MNNLSIIIPTVKYTEYLDEAIQSCMELKYIKTNIFVNINSESDSFQNSRYWENSKVQWRYIEKTTMYMRESLIDAIEHSFGDWLFILSDDDKVHDNFLKDVCISDFSESTLFLTRINIVNELGKLIHENSEYTKTKYSRDEILDLFLNNKIHHHLSLLVFSRKLYNEVGGFVFTGYPEEYYIDTVFHGKAFANSDAVYTSNEIIFSRRESSFQASAKFNFDNVNQYFNVIVDALLENENFSKEVFRKYGEKGIFLRKMIQDRFFIEYGKLSQKTFNKYTSKKITFLYKQLFWNTGIWFKLLSPLYAIKIEIAAILPLKVKQAIKNLIYKC